MPKNIRFWLSITDENEAIDTNVVNMDRSKRGGYNCSVQLKKKIALIHQVDYKSFGKF